MAVARNRLPGEVSNGAIARGTASEGGGESPLLKTSGTVGEGAVGSDLSVCDLALLVVLELVGHGLARQTLLVPDVLGNDALAVRVALDRARVAVHSCQRVRCGGGGESINSPVENVDLLERERLGFVDEEEYEDDAPNAAAAPDDCIASVSEV